MNIYENNHAFPGRALSNFIWSLLVCGLASFAAAQDDLSEPFPSPSSNAALHYNRALLSLSMMEPESREILTKPIWDELRSLSSAELKSKLSTLMYASRHAIRAALLGCQQEHADFGIDYSDYGLGAMPHVDPMLQLGRLLTLCGLNEQRKGEWKQAGFTYFYGLRLGRHMTDQPTLVEALTGVEILENNYFGLANWATRCPDQKLVQRASSILEVFSEDMVSPANTLLHEARIISQRCNKLKSAFPDGHWAEMLMESLDRFEQASSKEELEKKAVAFCVEKGIPREAFANKESFDAQVEKIRLLWMQCFEDTSISMLLPPKARVLRGRQIYDEYREKLRRLGDEGMLDPAEIGIFFAVHDAELAMARVVLALAASRTEAGFPASLDAVAARFGGAVPTNPYDNSPLQYAVSDDGKHMTLTVAEVQVGDAKLPEIKFSTAGR